MTSIDLNFDLSIEVIHREEDFQAGFSWNFLNICSTDRQTNWLTFANQLQYTFLFKGSITHCTWHGLLMCGVWWRWRWWRRGGSRIVVFLVWVVISTQQGGYVIQGHLFNEGGAIFLEIPPLKYLKETNKHHRHAKFYFFFVHQFLQFGNHQVLCHLQIYRYLIPINNWFILFIWQESI